MVTDLEEIINFYQWEVHRLELLIENNIDLREFEEAEFNQNALIKANELLEIHLNLQNPLYSKIKYTKWQIERISAISKKNCLNTKNIVEDPYYKDLKDQLNTLVNTKITQSEETQYLDDALYKLVEENNIEVIKLHFPENLTLEMVYLDKVIVLTFVFEKELIQDTYLFTKVTRILKTDGFISNNQNLEFRYEVHNSKNLYPLKVLISKYVFEFKSYSHTKQALFLELIPKQTT